MAKFHGIEEYDCDFKITTLNDITKKVGYDFKILQQDLIFYLTISDPDDEINPMNPISSTLGRVVRGPILELEEEECQRLLHSGILAGLERIRLPSFLTLN